MKGRLTFRKNAPLFRTFAMTGLVTFMLSLAVLAAFALAGGGVYLIFARGERKQGVLMVLAALVLFANVAIWTV
jgi:hypothetical protein